MASGTAQCAWTSTVFTQMFASGNPYWAVAATVAQTLFDGGTRLHQQRAAEAAYEQSAAQYRATVIGAFQNVADALHALVADAETLKAAVAADPHDPAKRLRAWLTPFFAVSLAELPAAAAGADQPLIDRLLAWHAAAEGGDLAELFGRILDDSGLARRELFAGEAMRRLTNFQQLFELLAVDAARAARPLGDVARRLAGLVAKLVIPEPEEGNTLRAEGVPFIAPVVIDDTREGGAVVPAEFLRVQWTRLPGALPTPQFVEQIKRLLSAPTPITTYRVIAPSASRSPTSTPRRAST